MRDLYSRKTPDASERPWWYIHISVHSQNSPREEAFAVSLTPARLSLWWEGAWVISQYAKAFVYVCRGYNLDNREWECVYIRTEKHDTAQCTVCLHVQSCVALPTESSEMPKLGLTTR